MRERLGIFISGGGTTMAEIIKATENDWLPVDIGCVVSSNPQADGIYKALCLGVPKKDINVVSPQDFRESNGSVDSYKFGEKLLSVLQDHGVTVVTQNGWLPKTPTMVIDALPGKIFNQHPGPVPEFGGKGMYGRRVHAAVLLFRRLTGSTDMWTEAIAQRAAPEFDMGTVIKSQRVEILRTDTVEDLQQRILPIEHRLQIELLQSVVNGIVEEKPVRSDSLILKHQGETLNLARNLACMLYPKG